MENEQELLKYIYNEDLYLIDEPSMTPDSITTEEKVEDSPEVQPEEQVNEPSPVKFLGSNNKGILVLVNDTESEFLQHQSLDFLMKIVESGLKYAKTDIAIVNAVKYPYWQIFDEIHHSFLIAFGNHPVENLQEQTKYQVFDNDGIRTLLAEDLDIIEGDVEKKKQLWKALQRMFDLD